MISNPMIEPNLLNTSFVVEQLGWLAFFHCYEEHHDECTRFVTRSIFLVQFRERKPVH